MRSTSSIHRRHPILVFLPGICIPMGFFSLAISSISVAYCSTDRTSLSFILISLVIPSFVLIFAFGPWFSFLIIFHVGPITLLLWRAYIIPSSHALSNAFVTSRYVCRRGFSSFFGYLLFLLV